MEPPIATGIGQEADPFPCTPAGRSSGLPGSARHASSHQQDKVERILRALAEVVYEVGPSRLTVASIIERAGISRSAFYESFDNRQAALRSAIALAGRQLRSAVGTTPGPGATWAQHVEQVISALLAAVVDEPALATLCLLYADADPEVQNPVHPLLVDALVTLLQGERRRPATDAGPPLTKEFVAYGVLSIIADTLRRRKIENSKALSKELTELLVLYFPRHEDKWRERETV